MWRQRTEIDFARVCGSRCIVVQIISVLVEASSALAFALVVLSASSCFGFLSGAACREGLKNGMTYVF